MGTARFVDHKSRLCCEVVFGKVADQPDEPLLQRSDSFSATLYQFSESSQPPNGAAHNVSCCLLPAPPHHKPASVTPVVQCFTRPSCKNDMHPPGLHAGGDAVCISLDSVSTAGSLWA